MITIDGADFEVWSNGPLFGTVWARDGGGVFHVIHVTKNELVAYEPPPGFTYLPSSALDMAREIVHREWRWLVHRDPYLSSVQGRDGDRDIVRPEPAQLQAAHEVIRRWDLSNEAVEAYRHGHVATNALGEARLLELLRQTVVEGDGQCATEITYSAATETPS